MSVKKSSRPRDAVPHGPLDLRETMFTNLLLLGFDRSEMEGRFNVPFTKDMFAVPNKKCFEVVMHFLFEQLNLPMAQDRFRYCWPITDKKQEQAFRKVVNNWLTEIKEEEDCHLPRIVPSLFLSPGGDKFYTFLLHFSRYVINRVILKQIGVKESELLRYPQLGTKEAEFFEQVGRALETSCVRHRRSFLTHLHKDLMLQEQWSAYASELTGEYRRVGKEIRELEAQIKQEEARLMAQAKARGSPTITRRRRSGALLDAEWDTMAVTRTQKVQKVREMWKTLATSRASQRQELEVVESILEGAAGRYRVDGAELRVQVPEMLLRECHKELEKQNIDNIYQGGKLNLISLIQLWNLSLRLYLEKLHQAPMADFESLNSEIVTQVHTYHAHLTNLQSLRSSMSQDVLPSIKSSIGTLKKTLMIGHEAPTRQRASNTNASHFLGNGLGLLPATPPVSFEPVSAAQASNDTPTRPMNKAFWKASPTVNTPEAVSSLVNNVNQTVHKQSSLAQGTPTSSLGLLREQINRPSRLPKPAPAKASHLKADKRRIHSAPAGSQHRSLSEEESTLKLEDSNVSISKPNESDAKSQPRSGTKQSRTPSVQKIKNRRTPSTSSTRKTDRKPGSTKGGDKSGGTSHDRSGGVSGDRPGAAATLTPHTKTPARSRPLDDRNSTSVSRAHQDLIDQIADAVVGAMSGSPQLRGLMESPLSSSSGNSPVPLGIEDPLSVLDQSAFVTRDKLKHSPVYTPASLRSMSTPAYHAASPLAQPSPAQPSFPKPSSANIPQSSENGDSDSLASSASVKQRTSNGSQKSVTFSDHVDERNISVQSYGSDLNDSSMNGDVFVNGMTPSPAKQSRSEATNRITQTPNGTSMGTSVEKIAEGYLSPSPEHQRVDRNIALSSSLDKVFALDDITENGHDDFLLDNSDRLEDLLVHVSPFATPSTTPKLDGNGSRLRYRQDVGDSPMNDDIFPSSGLHPSPDPQSDIEINHPILNEPTPLKSTPSLLTPASANTSHNSSAERDKANSRLELSHTDRPFSLDNTFENGPDISPFDTSSRLDLLAHVSPLVTPSATPKLNGNRNRPSHLADASFGSAPNSTSKSPFHRTPHLNDSLRYSLPANISGLSFGDDSPLDDASFLKVMDRFQTPSIKTPSSGHKTSAVSSHTPLLHVTPKTNLDFNLLDEDDSVLLPPSPYAPSPQTDSVGQLIDI